MTLKNHDLASPADAPGLKYEELPLLAPDKSAVPGLHTVRMTLDNPSQLNAYTTDMVRGMILGMRRASNDRGAVAVVITGAGSRSFFSRGHTAEYAEDYAGKPDQYRQYLRVFVDMITSILICDKPIINRVNGMRI